MSKKWSVLVCAGLLAVLAALPAVAAEYYTWDAWATFSPWSYNNSPANCATPGCGDNTGSGACWQADVTTNPGHLIMDLWCAPTDATQWYRMQYSTSSPYPTFGAYPYEKMKLTVSGVPEGEVIKWLMPIEPRTGGGKYRRSFWLGNGTYTLIQYMGDGTVVYDADGDTGNPDPVSTWEMKRFRPGTLVSTAAGWETAWEDVSIDIDWIVVTDNRYYPDSSAAAGEEITKNKVFAIEGQSLVLSAPSGTSHQWYKGVNPVYDDERVHPADVDLPPTRLAGALSQNLTINTVEAGDAGTYSCVYDDGSKATMLSPDFELVVYAAPVVGDAIVSNPPAGLIVDGHKLVLTAPAGLAHQWLKGGEILDGETEETLVFDPVHVADMANYECLYDEGGTLKVTPALALVVDTAGTGGVITSNPVPGWIEAGGPLTLTGPAGTGHQWFVDGALVADNGRISGADEQVLAFAPVLVDDAGVYTVLYGDGSKALLESQPFVLEVLPAGSLPLGLAGMVAVAAALAAFGARRTRRR